MTKDDGGHRNTPGATMRPGLVSVVKVSPARFLAGANATHEYQLHPLWLPLINVDTTIKKVMGES